MKRYHKKYFNSRVVIALLAFVFNIISLPASAATVNSPLDLATIPLANSPTVTIQPNLLFILDDSGSMSWDYMPDWANSSTPERFRNASYNTVAYNPAISYLPPVFFDAGGFNTTQYPSQTGQSTATGASSATKPNWRQVKNNAYTGSGYPSGTQNLETEAAYYHTIPGEYCAKPDLKDCVTQSSPSASYPFPAPVRWCDTSANASAAVPAAGSCQASRVGTYDELRAPTQRTATIKIDNSNSCTTVNGILVDSVQIMAAAINCSSTESTTASRIMDEINACTYAKTGNCSVAGYRASRSSSTITIFAPTTVTVTPSAPTTSGGSISTTITAFVKNNVPGEVLFVPITSSVASYALPGSGAKASTRTDCAGSTCTYVEEMTNYANWHTYYGTRGQAMKTSASIAFKDVGEDFRVGFMTTSTRSAQMLNFATFNNAHKANWYSMFFSAPADRNTPLRGALSKAGRIYANETLAKRGVFTDPMEYECQQNFTLLTTDGYWNTGDETATYAGGPLGLTGTNVGNMDSASAGTPRPQREGTTARSDTLADVAKYYFDTDIRTVDLGNHIGALGSDVSQSPPPSTANQKQNMVTFTLGMGVDGVLSYTTDYKTATAGDFADIKNGTKNWPDPIGNSGPERIDDLWHAAVNGGGTYFSAKNPQELVSSLKEALASIKVKLGAATAAATSTLNPVAGDNNAYVASYTSGFWTGNLEKRSIDIETGEVVSTSEDRCVEDVVSTSSCTTPSSVVADGNGGYDCVTPAGSGSCSGTVDCIVPMAISCTGTLKNKVADFTDTRTIKMNSGGTLTDFNYSTISALGLGGTFASTFLAANLTQWPTLTAAQQANVTPENLVNYLRGQKGFDENAGDVNKRVFRKRQAVLGDAVESKPAFVGKPTFNYSDAGYAEFKATKASRTKVVFMGANDGMLHAFDANTLEELWAYVPTPVIRNMWKLADMRYGDVNFNLHSFYVNADPIISDICVSGCGSDGATWKTILVAGLNGGGRGYYALDITNPASPSLMWEFTPNQESNLGYTFGNPVITKLPDATGTWVVLVTSGYNNIPDNSSFYDLTTTKFKPNNPAQYTSGDGKGYLYVLNATTGAKIAQIETGVGNTSTPSGLGKIKAYADDAEKNNTTTYVYGGDLLGNLWRFDLSNYSKMLFASLQASGGQPITTEPELGYISNKRVVFVGTGKYLEVSDLLDTSQQTIYGIKDDETGTTLVNPRSSLVEQTIVENGVNNRKSGTTNPVDFATGRGWYVDLPDPGERQNVSSQLVLGTLLVPTTVPTSSACQPAGYGWFNFFDYKTGAAVPLTDNVSVRTGAPTVGFNIVYIKGKPKVSLVTADDPIPKLQPDIPFEGSGSGFQKKRSIWREIIN